LPWVGSPTPQVEVEGRNFGTLFRVTKSSETSNEISGWLLRPPATLAPTGVGSQLAPISAIIDAKLPSQPKHWRIAKEGRLLSESLDIEGKIVEFEIGENEKGPCAINVCPIDELRTKPLPGESLLGAIKSLTATFGFIKLDRGGDLFFHRTNCTEGTQFLKLAVGERVRCLLEVDAKGRRRGIRVEGYSGV
jgi:cold shock CspA family protein